MLNHLVYLILKSIPIFFLQCFLPSFVTAIKTSTNFFISCIAPGDWSRLRHLVATRVDYRCECCGVQCSRTSGDGLPRLDAHERWRYQYGTQKLMRIVALCEPCHEATNMGLAEVKGHKYQATAQCVSPE